MTQTLHRRPQMLAPRQMADVMPRSESHDMISEPLWVVDESSEGSRKEMDFSSSPLTKAPSRKECRSNLRITTYPKVELHDRYMSDEEEPSPSPDSENESGGEGELKHKIHEIRTEEFVDASTAEEYKAEIAIAVPIKAMGRPKLVDITNLAPMHKRKRTEKPRFLRSAIKNAATRIPAATDEDSTHVSQEDNKVATPEEHLPKRKDSLPVPAPESWLPEGDSRSLKSDDQYFPELELRKAPTYNDYDPYSLSPPKLSPRNSYITTKKPGSIARARKASAPPSVLGNAAGWKGLTRSLSIANRQEAQLWQRQVAKKPKMLARGANEREELPEIPPFPFQEIKYLN